MRLTESKTGLSRTCREIVLILCLPAISASFVALSKNSTVVQAKSASSPSEQASPPPRRESVRAELTRLQKQTGLSLVSASWDVLQYVDLKHHGIFQVQRVHGGVISPDGKTIAFASFHGVFPTHLAISRIDGNVLHEYPNLEQPADMCWSHNGSKLAVMLSNREAGSPNGLIVWNFESQTSEQIARRGSLTIQCWSPSDKEVVYEVEGAMVIRDLEKSASRDLGRGKWPTWSPDGEWIAFLDHDRFYAVRPDGGDRKVLFQHKGASSALWWSPDCRFGAYLAMASMFAGGLSLDVENYRLRVIRFSDNSDDWVANSGYSEYQWITSLELLRETEAKPIPQ